MHELFARSLIVLMVYDISMDNNQFEAAPSTPESAPEPMPTVTPEATLTPEPEPATPSAPTQKSRKGLKLVAIILLVLLAVAGVGYSAYAMMQNASQKTQLSDKDAQINTLNVKVASLETKTSSTTAATATKSTGNVIPIRELGLSITVPDSIKDLTYSYSSSSYGESTQFSTKAITKKYQSKSECTSFGSAPPLGAISKSSGKAPVEMASAQVVKQFSDYYVSYSSPQATCSDTQTSAPPELQIFKDSLTTLKEL